jgi:hypothetical protein
MEGELRARFDGFCARPGMRLLNQHVIVISRIVTGPPF